MSDRTQIVLHGRSRRRRTTVWRRPTRATAGLAEASNAPERALAPAARFAIAVPPEGHKHHALGRLHRPGGAAQQTVARSKSEATMTGRAENVRVAALRTAVGARRVTPSRRVHS